AWPIGRGSCARAGTNSRSPSPSPVSPSVMRRRSPYRRRRRGRASAPPKTPAPPARSTPRKPAPKGWLHGADRMNSLETSGNAALWRYQKVWEGDDAFVLFVVQALDPKHRASKLHLIVDARPGSSGVRLVEARPDALKPQGAVVALMRKYAGS